MPLTSVNTIHLGAKKATLVALSIDRATVGIRHSPIAGKSREQCATKASYSGAGHTRRVGTVIRRVR